MADWRPYSELEIGSTFPDTPFAFAVTAEVVAGYRALTSRSALEADAPVDADSVPPTLAAIYIRGAQNALRGPPGGIHAKQHFTVLRPVHIGETLFTTLTIADKYERKGRNYVECVTDTRDASGIQVTRGRITSIWGREA